MESTVFIVDDEEIICRSLAAIFRRSEIKTVYETNPLRALEHFEAHNYNVALVDVLMPGVSGREVIARFKQMNPMCNVIVMTAFSNMTHVVECVEAGAIDYITKPFTDVELLTEIVRSALERVARWRRSFGLEWSKEERAGDGVWPAGESETGRRE